ncbi:MAG: ABC transporter permease subunit [Actinomycetota bacterium]
MTRLLQIAVAAVPVGSVYALAASGLVLTYRTSRVFNFAHGAVGMFCAFLFYQAWVAWKLPVGIAFVLVVAVFAPAMALLLERVVFRRLRDAATSVKVVVTVGLLIALQGGASAIWGSQGSLFLPPLFPQGSVRIAGGVRLGFDQLAILAISVGTMVVLGAVIRFTPFGLRVRAGVDRPDLAELSGVDTARVSAISWAIGFATAAMAGILLSPTLGLDSYTLTLFVIQAFAAALIGRLESFPLVFLGGMVVSLLEQMATAYLPSSCSLCLAVRPAIPFALIFGLLAFAAMVPGSRLGRWVRTGTGEPSAPPPVAARPGPGGRTTVVAVVAALAVAAPLLPDDWLLREERGLVMAGVFASLVLLSGLSGQISLTHTAFVGTGAFTMAVLASHGVPWPVALGVAGLAVVPVAIFVALPAIRLQGLNVALITFGFGLVVAQVFQSTLTGGTTGMTAPRPSFATSSVAYCYVLLAVATALVLVVRNVQRSATGRILAAIRDSEPAARSIGVRLPIYRLAVFALSAFMAAIGGAALASLQGLVTFNDFHPLFSLIWLSVAVIGGLGTAAGAVVGAALWGLGSTSVGALPQVAFGLGAMLLAHNERGIAGAWPVVRRALGRAGDVAGRAAAAHDALPLGAVRMPSPRVRTPVEHPVVEQPVAEVPEWEATPHGAA